MSAKPIALKIEIETDSGTPFLGRLLGAMQGDRRDFLGYVARNVAEASREHVRMIAPTRHATAQRLGAKPTGHLTRAADSIEGQWNNSDVFLVFPRTTGLSRAFRDFKLKPVTPGIKFLTIAASARSYGKRAREFNDLEFDMVESTYNGRTATRRALVFPDGSVAYWLFRSVFIPQDRGLLPSDQQFARAAEVGARDYIKDLSDA